METNKNKWKRRFSLLTVQLVITSCAYFLIGTSAFLLVPTVLLASAAGLALWIAYWKDRR